jgi:PAS domain S-box-containing protein
MIRDFLQRSWRRAGATPSGRLGPGRDLASAEVPAVRSAGEEQFRRLVEAVKDYAIFMLDADGRVATWNAGAERIKGYRADEIIGRHFSIFYPQESVARGWPEQELVAARERGSFEDENWRVRQDGSMFWANVVITAVYDDSGGLRGYAKVTRDLTERRRAEEELRAAHADLEQRVAQRTAELSEANSKLRLEIERRRSLESELRAVGDELRKRALELAQADRQKNEFLAMLAHELRNPMAPIANGLEILGRSASDPRSAAMTEMMRRQLDTLVRLVDDLLDVSRIVQNRIELHRERVSLDQVVQAALETVGPVIEAHGHHIRIALPEGPVAVDGDVVRLGQVLANLLLNAAKFSDRPATIELAAEYIYGSVAIHVRDQGIGIAPDLLPRVFDLFAQGDHSLDRSRGGLGIGLTLSRRLVELHGGTLTASSAGPGQGSEFVVQLPAELDGPDAEAAAPVRLETTPSKPRRVLVVDDSVDAGESTAALIRLWGHQTRVLTDAAGVLDVLRGFRPDVVLLDIGLPGIDGYDLARQIRAVDGGDRVVLAALTGYGRDEDRRLAEEAGFDHHLVKPVDIDRLEAILAG